ncbi:MAG: M10 family metallopeptidase domain-containing protein [Actinomycetota bacterium]|nr:M10 family metallopeptidase domain-containing protein [Actinomycetota bacterium]
MRPLTTAAVLVAALAMAACSGSEGPVEEIGGDVPASSAATDCPAAGHRDTFASGLTPDRIPSLPNGYSFTFVKDDGCTPVRFDPCQPVHYVVNAAHAPPTGVADVEEAFRRLADVTGMTFVNDGPTDEVTRTGPYVEDLYPGRWAPVLVVWRRGSGDRAGVEVVGSGFPYRVQDVLVSGVLTLNSDAVTDRSRNTPLAGGFSPVPGFGAIGAEGVTWGRVILHELAHVVGLGHTRDRDQLMYPETAEQTAHVTDYRTGDRDGLRVLGRASGCLSAPAPTVVRSPG